MEQQNEPVSEKHLSGEQILNGMPELAYVFDQDGRMVMWNKNVELVLGYTAEELYHKQDIELIDEADRERTQERVSRIFAEKKQHTIDYHLVTKSGKRIPYIGSGSYTVINGIEYLVGQAINISKLKEAEKRMDVLLSEIQILKDQLEAENIYLRKEISISHNFEDILGKSEPLMRALFRVEQVAPLDTTVLLEGETGTGKELFARAIHNLSNRRNKPFIKVNCTALPSNLIESALFGQEKGTFVDAVLQQTGRFEFANLGTIFLDEIGELPLEIQPKILQVLQEGVFERTGNSRTVKVDVRIIAATSRNLEEDVQREMFRKDLYYQLNVYPITIVPLRERISDIPILTENFVKRFNLKLGKNITKIHSKTMRHVQSYRWPGNIRELENVIERAVIISPSSQLVVESLQNSGLEETNELLPLNEFERQYIIKVLGRSLWRVDGPDGAARILDMHPETLRSRMRKLGIKRPGL